MHGLDCLCGLFDLGFRFFSFMPTILFLLFCPLKFPALDAPLRHKTQTMDHEKQSLIDESPASPRAAASSDFHST